MPKEGSGFGTRKRGTVSKGGIKHKSEVRYAVQEYIAHRLRQVKLEGLDLYWDDYQARAELMHDLWAVVHLHEGGRGSEDALEWYAGVARADLGYNDYVDIRHLKPLHIFTTNDGKKTITVKGHRKTRVDNYGIGANNAVDRAKKVIYNMLTEREVEQIYKGIRQ